MGSLEYVARLWDLGLYSVSGRLLRADLIKIWKILHCGQDSELVELFEVCVTSRTRGHSLKLVMPACRSEFRTADLFHTKEHSVGVLVLVEISFGTASLLLLWS